MNQNLLTTSIALVLSLSLGAAETGLADTQSTTGNVELWVDGPANVQPGTGRNNPDVAVDGTSRSIFVWRTTSAAGGNADDVFLRRFDATGNPLEDPIFVNTLTAGNQRYPRVAVAADGSFLVIWQSTEGDNRIWVRSQAFDANADTVGTEQLVSNLATGESVDVNADVAALQGGGYVVVWRSRNTGGNDPNLSIQARFVSAAGVADPSGQFQVNSTIGENDRDPAVTELADGGFLVVWVDPEVHGRRFNATGTALGNDFQINTLVSSSQLDPDVALASATGILVVWKDAEDAGEDFEIRGRLYDNDLTPQGNDFPINNLITGVQDVVRVGDYGDGGFFVAWESASSNGSDSEPNSIQARMVTGSNQFAGPQIQVNVWTAGDQGPSGVGGWDGRVAVVWRSAGNPDASNSVITAQFWEFGILSCDIFCDGFESGDTTAWSNAVP